MSGCNGGNCGHCPECVTEAEYPRMEMSSSEGWEALSKLLAARQAYLELEGARDVLLGEDACCHACGHMLTGSSCPPECLRMKLRATLGLENPP